MSLSAESLRKVAIVLASLDSQAADALIDRMPEERARLVRQALTELAPLDPAEQEAVVAEFLRQGQAARQAELAGVEVEADLAQRLELEAPTYQASPSPAPPLPSTSTGASQQSDAEAQDMPGGEPFAFLHQLDADELVAHLERERPQTLAVVVAYLPSDRSADLISRLPGETQAQVLRRLAELGELDPHMVREVERGVRQRMARHTAASRPRRRGPGAVASILRSAGREARRQLLESLAAHQPEFAARVAPPAAAEPEVAFDELASVSSLALARILAECDADVLILALAGAHPAFARRVLEQLPAHDARSLRRQLDGLGPTRLSDVERAQQEVVAAARRLHAQGSIELGARRELSLTV